MLIFTIETCTDTTTLGVVADGVVRAEAAFPSRYTLVKRLLSRLDWLLAEAGVSKEQLEMIVVSLGPGAFTGVRIGVAAAKTLALWLNIPLVGVPTLEALAYPFRHCEPTLLVPLVNARRQQVYVALYRGEQGSLHRLTPDQVLGAEAFAALLQQQPATPKLFIGQLEGLPEAFRDLYNATQCPIRSLVTPHALAVLGAERFARGEVADAMTLAPIYLRDAAD